MARSNAYTFNLTRDGLITAAFQLVNIIQVTDTVSSEDNYTANILLNAMIKDWEMDGICLWKRRQGVLFPGLATNQYSLGSTGANASATVVTTTSSAAAAASATTITATTVTGMTAADYIGIELDSGSRQWTTISSINTNTKVITLSVALTGAAASGNTICTYTTKINRPLRILRATVYNLTTAAETQLMPVSYDDYFNIPLKTTAGKPNNFYYDKLLDAGTLYLFPTTNNVKEIIKFTYHDSIMDVTSANNDFDFPQEWFLTLLYGLAVELCYAYQKFQELPMYEKKAEQLKSKAKEWDADEEALHISIDKRRTR